MIVFRVFEPEVVQAIVSHPGVKPEIWDLPGEPVVPVHEQIHYLVASRGKEPMGVVAFFPLNPAAWDLHMAVLPKHRGCGAEFLKLAAAWMFKNTACRKLTCAPPVFKAAMLRVLEKCGFVREGLSTKSIPWHGEMHDRVLMGLEKGVS